jgi:iron complex outermembrane recepter protein
MPEFRIYFLQMHRCIFAFVLLTAIQWAAHAQNPPAEIKRLSIEELLDLDVTSVSRRAEPLGQTAAAVTVITGEDIRRSGATSIPEALRLVPGLEVARFNAGSWAISSRGFNSTAANKLLVMIDGRTVYSPLFSGTFWEIQDMPLDDIARIEVVRGPGATLWGANAVNGIINIITKSAHQTKGTVFIATGGGAEDLAAGTLRAGAALGVDTSYRVFGKYFYRDQLKFANGADANDSMRLGRTGFRLDSTHGSDDFMVTGDFYNSNGDLANTPLSARVLGGSMLGRWNRTISNRSQLQLQTSYERMDRRIPGQSDFHQKIFDIDLQDQIMLGLHNVVWGAGYRWNHDDTIPTPVLLFSPQDRTYPVTSAFVQDEMSLRGNQVKLSLGSKFEHNDFSGFEAQPSARISWAIKPEHFVWGAVTRAVRTPTRFDSDIRFGPPFLQFVGNPDFKAENVLTYEVGYRTGARRFSYDISTFFNVYDNLRSLELQGGPTTLVEFNNLNAHTYGAELSGKYDAFEWLRFNLGYWFLQEKLKTDPGHFDFFNGTIEGNDPRNQFFIRGSADVAHNIELDSTLRFVDNLLSPPVPHYTELDARFGWNLTPKIELSIIGRNLLDRQHPEFGPPGPFREETQRNVYGRVAIRF